MKKIFCLVGQCATGKTSCEVRLANEYNYNRIISYTTRPMRSNEVDGVDYHFISDEEFDKRKDSGDFLEQTEYLVAGKRFRYALPRSGIRDDVPNIVVVNPHGVKQLIEDEWFRQNMTTIYLVSSLSTRIKRYLERETDSQKYQNLCERILRDIKDFDEFDKLLKKDSFTNVFIQNEIVTLDELVSEIHNVIEILSNE